jgi:hypothetical protein
VTRWCVDEAQVVHNTMCKAAVGAVTHYVSKPKTNVEMLDSLARPDSAHGHEAPGLIRGCEFCIPVDEETL